MTERAWLHRGTKPSWEFQTMVVCETCGNKRCPHATDAKWECTGSNEPGQVPKEVEDD